MKSCLGTGFLMLILLAGIGGGFSLIHSGMNSGSVQSLIWGGLLTIVCSFLLIGQLIISDRIRLSNTTRALILFAIPIAVLIVVFAVSWVMIQNSRPPAKVLSALTEVCDHKGVAAAGEYKPGESTLPRVVLLNADGSIHNWTSEVNPEWRPTSLEQLELVICLGKIERRVTETCTTQHGTIKMQVEEMYVEIIAARSGEVLASRRIVASPPPKCPIQGGFYKPSEWRSRVTSLSYLEVEKFVTAFLATPRSDIVTASTPATQSEEPISVAEESTPGANDEVQQTILGIVTVSSARVRSGPGTQFGVVAGLRNGEQVTILGRNPEDTWYKIELPDGESGWASAELIQLQDADQEIPLVEGSEE